MYSQPGLGSSAADWNRLMETLGRIGETIDDPNLWDSIAASTEGAGKMAEPAAAGIAFMLFKAGEKCHLKPNQGMIGFVGRDGKVIGGYFPQKIGHADLASQLNLYEQAKNSAVYGFTLVKSSDGTIGVFGSSFGALPEYLKPVIIKMAQ